MMSVEMESPLTVLGQEMMFSLVLQSRQRASRYHSLLAILPFLGLDGQLRAAVHGHGRNGLSPILWSVLRWFNWTGGTVNQQWSVTNNLPPTAANQVVAAGDSSSPAKAPGEQAPLLPLLYPVLLMTRPSRGGRQLPQSSHILPPGHRAPATVVESTRRDAAVSTPMTAHSQAAVTIHQPTTAVNQPEPFTWSQLAGKGEPTASTTPLIGEQIVAPRTQIKNDDALPNRKTLPDLADLSSGQPPTLPGLNPSLIGILGVATGTYAAMNQEVQRKRPFASPWKRPLAPPLAFATLALNRAVLPAVATHLVDNTEGPTLLPAPSASRPATPGERQNGREPERYAPSPAQGLAIVTSAIERLVKQEVTTEIKRQKEGESLLNNRQDEPSPPTAPQPLNDDMVRQLMVRMRDLVQEDRFRMGRIR